MYWRTCTFTIHACTCTCESKHAINRRSLPVCNFNVVDIVPVICHCLVQQGKQIKTLVKLSKLNNTKC